MNCKKKYYFFHVILNRSSYLLLYVYTTYYKYQLAMANDRVSDDDGRRAVTVGVMWLWCQWPKVHKQNDKGAKLKTFLPLIFIVSRYTLRHFWLWGLIREEKYWTLWTFLVRFTQQVNNQQQTNNNLIKKDYLMKTQWLVSHRVSCAIDCLGDWRFSVLPKLIESIKIIRNSCCELRRWRTTDANFLKGKTHYSLYDYHFD